MFTALKLPKKDDELKSHNYNYLFYLKPNYLLSLTNLCNYSYISYNILDNNVGYYIR